MVNALATILANIRDEINAGAMRELTRAGSPVSYVGMPADDVAEEWAAFTAAVVDTLAQDDFAYLQAHWRRVCRRRLAQRVKLADIMVVFDLYEKALKDAMSRHLDLPRLNHFRREIDTLLDRARVFVTDYFFRLYEDTVFKQFEQLRIINEVSTCLTSTLNLPEVLYYVVSNGVRLLRADCGSVVLYAADNAGVAKPVSHGWWRDDSPPLAACSLKRQGKLAMLTEAQVQDGLLKDVFVREGLAAMMMVKLCLQDRILGQLILGLRNGEFSSADKQLASTFANNAAMAVNNALLYGETDQKLQQRIREVTFLLEQNRAILHSLREGVVAVDIDGRVTLANNEAIRLLECAPDIVGQPVENVIPNTRLRAVVQSKRAEYDQEQQLRTKAIITNRVPVIVNGEVTGAIATFRDKQDVKSLAEELVGVRSLLDSMRAQSHEFINKLHAISGLIQMEQYDKVVALINQIYRAKQNFVSFLVKRVKDKATAGLLLGKISQAQEKGIQITVSPRSRLTALPPQFSSVAMVTVLGNLISNAIDAVQDLSAERRHVTVCISQGRRNLCLTVRDTGDGIPPQVLPHIFRRGFSTKAGGRGVGLALVQQEVTWSGGTIAVRTECGKGCAFMVKIPYAVASPANCTDEEECRGNGYWCSDRRRRSHGSGAPPAVCE